MSCETYDKDSCQYIFIDFSQCKRKRKLVKKTFFSKWSFNRQSRRRSILWSKNRLHDCLIWKSGLKIGNLRSMRRLRISENSLLTEGNYSTARIHNLALISCTFPKTTKAPQLWLFFLNRKTVIYKWVVTLFHLPFPPKCGKRLWRFLWKFSV